MNAATEAWESLPSPPPSKPAKAQRFPASTVHVVRLYDVQCDACNGSASEELFTDRSEAEEARRAHIDYHRREG